MNKAERFCRFRAVLCAAAGALFCGAEKQIARFFAFWAACLQWDNCEVSEEDKKLEALRREHASICRNLGLSKPMTQRGADAGAPPKAGLRPYAVLGLSLIVVAAAVGAYAAFYRYAADRESELAIAKHEAELAREQARRDRIEYADIAFLDSLPPHVAISMDGKALYAKTADGAYTELRARESAWVRNLPIKEDTVLKFGFSAEGFKTLTRSVAYYDWFPNRSPGGSGLQKAFKRIVLEPDNAPRVAACADLARIGDADPCEWSVFREIAFRERYRAAAATAAANPEQTEKRVAQNMILHPDMFRDVGLQPDGAASLPADASDAARALWRHVSDNPYGMYGRITIESDTPGARVFFMGEPLMILKPSGSYAQVQVSPDRPHAFSVFGNGRPIDIMQPMSIRLEAPGKPAYIAEITPLQWHCEVPDIEVISRLTPPAIPEALMTPDYRHYMCDYRITVSAKFGEFGDRP